MPHLAVASSRAGNLFSSKLSVSRVSLAAALLMQASLSGAVSQLELGYDLEYGPDSETLQSSSGTHQELTLSSLVESGDETGTYGKATYSGEAQFGYLKTSSHSDFTYAFSVGSISSSAHPDILASGVGASWDLNVGVGAQGQERAGGFDNDTASRTGNPIQNFATIEFDFVWGTEFTYSTTLGAFTGVNVLSPEWAIADVTNLELQLTGIAVKADDTFGSFVAIEEDDFTISADSGTAYPKISAIPEPGTPLLLLLSAAALGFVRRRR